jgi:hypothetical protein
MKVSYYGTGERSPEEIIGAARLLINGDADAKLNMTQ